LHGLEHNLASMFGILALHKTGLLAQLELDLEIFADGLHLQAPTSINHHNPMDLDLISEFKEEEEEEEEELQQRLISEFACIQWPTHLIQFAGSAGFGQ